MRFGLGSGFVAARLIVDMAFFSRLTALGLILAGVCSAVEKHDLQSLNEQYDYVVVGGGVSGLVVANRLTEDANSMKPIARTRLVSLC